MNTKIQQVQRWRTSDGREFTTEDEAQRHEHFIAIHALLKARGLSVPSHGYETIQMLLRQGFTIGMPA